MNEVNFPGAIAKPRVILLRLQDEKVANKIEVISKLLTGYGDKLLDRFVVVFESGVKIRPLPYSKSDE